MGPAVRTIVTADGSSTLQQVETGWTYRSVHGAAVESRHVFIDGTQVFARGLGRPRILEFGLGAAANFAGTLAAHAKVGGGPLLYCAIEHAPLRAEHLCPDVPSAQRLAAAATLDGRAEHEGVVVEVHRCDFLDFDHPQRFDAVYFDPFGPTQQPDCWSQETFAVVRRMLAPGGRLATYAAAGWVRRNMASAGFHVATAAGPPGKRHFTVAATEPGILVPLKIRNRPRDE